MKLLVSGSRAFSATERVAVFLDAILNTRVPIELVVTGDCEGPDKVAQMWARAHNIPVEVVAADWIGDEDKAGTKRNGAMIEKTTQAVIYWDGESINTLDLICRAKKRKDYPVEVYIA